MTTRAAAECLVDREFPHRLVAALARGNMDGMTELILPGVSADCRIPFNASERQGSADAPDNLIAA